MLQLFRKYKGIVLDFIEDTWQGRFKYGIDFTLFKTFLNRFDNGAIKFCVTVGQLISPATGHWPFTTFECSFITGPRWGFHITVLGFCYGTLWLHARNEDGSVAGPDVQTKYVFFSCINNQNKPLEEIVFNAK